MDLAAPAVSLDKVTHLENHPGVLVNQLCSPLHKTWATLTPHFSVTGKLSPLDPVQPLYGLIVIRVIDVSRLGVEMSVSKNDDGVFITHFPVARFSILTA